MEDWQEWQIRADEIAASLNTEVDALEHEFFDSSSDATYRVFWPRFRDLKERVRTAPAIKLDDKLHLERRLRTLGSRAYKAQEAAYGKSGDLKTELLGVIGEFAEQAKTLETPRELRELRRELDRVRKRFEKGDELVPADRQQVWESWKEANQETWTLLTGHWNRNEAYLREILEGARKDVQRGNGQAARQALGRFYESLKTHEARQASINQLKAEADQIRQEADEAEQRNAAEKMPAFRPQAVPAIDVWRSEVDRNRAAMVRLQTEIAALDREFQDSRSILEQAMIRGNLVDKRRKLAELERSTRTLEQRIEQSEEAPLISAG